MKMIQEIAKLINPDLTQQQLLFDSNNWCLFSTVINPPPRSTVLTKGSIRSNIMFQYYMKEAIKFIRYHKYFHSNGFPRTHVSQQFVFFRKKTLNTIGDLSKGVDYVTQDSVEWVFCWVYPGGGGDSGGLVCTQSRKTLNYKNTSYYYLESWHNGSVLLANLLDVNTGPGKNIHQLRVLSALLITVPKTEISIVSPCVYLCWVCNEKANSWKHSLICAYCKAWCRTTERTSGLVPNPFFCLCKIQAFSTCALQLMNVPRKQRKENERRHM